MSEAKLPVKEKDSCPVGEPSCPCLDELALLRVRVDQLSEQVISDELTGVFNYRHLLWAMNQEIARARRTGEPFSIVIFDFDDFKKVNDTYGHDFGNRVLKAIGAFLRHSLRTLDVPCRFGGEEFVVVLPGTDLRDAIQLAERLRTGVEALELSSGEVQVPLTISAGVDSYTPADHHDADMLLDKTDKFLLSAKQAGKNRVHHRHITDVPDGMSTDERSALLDSFKGSRRSK